jgi:hypothetical protein
MGKKGTSKVWKHITLPSILWIKSHRTGCWIRGPLRRSDGVWDTRTRGWRGLMCLPMKIVWCVSHQKVSTFFLTRKFEAEKTIFYQHGNRFWRLWKISSLSREPITKFRFTKKSFLGQIESSKIIFWHTKSIEKVLFRPKKVGFQLFYCFDELVRVWLLLCPSLSHPYLRLFQQKLLAKVWRPAVLFYSSH